MEEQLAKLVLGRSELDDIRRTLAKRIAEGLEHDGREIKALPAWLAPPSRDLKGRALVVDTGGTNTRAAIVELDGENGARIVKGPIREKLPVRQGSVHLSREEFFALQARLAKQLDPTQDMPLGYCFSYP